MISFVKERFPTLNFICDRQIVSGCSKRRPDMFLDLLTHSIIIECDENQHLSYNISCETARINELFTDLGYRPMIFIKFNPDKYIDNKGKKIKSSFDQDKRLNIHYVKDKDEWKNRCNKLCNYIEKWINNVPLDTNIKYMFYDKKKE